MKEKIKIKFVDFWTDMNKPEGNHFYDLLSRKYEVEFSDYPQIIIYSNYGKQHLKYRCNRIFFSGENQRPNFKVCNYAITFDYLDDSRHLRFPLWGLYYLSHTKLFNAEQLDAIIENNELLKRWEAKSKFCCFIVSNGGCKKRNAFFRRLNEIKHVDSAGKYLNNIGYFLEGGSREKLEFIKDYKFVISFENSSYPGYTTEKILEPFLADCIPIYWGDPLVGRDFNTKRFINYTDFENEEEIIKRILEIDNNKFLALDILKEKCFAPNTKNIEDRTIDLLNFLSNGIDNRMNHPRVKKIDLFPFMGFAKEKIRKLVEKKLI